MEVTLNSRLALQSTAARQKVDDGASQKFEAHFIKKMLDAGNVGRIVNLDGEVGQQESNIFQNMHNQALADEIASSKSFGLADLIDRQINKTNQD